MFGHSPVALRMFVSATILVTPVIATAKTGMAMEENEHPVWAELRDMQAHERVSG